jgi:acyl-CoA thioesterase FadM
MAWATYEGGVWSMTARLEVRFRKPVQIGSEVVVHGRIVNIRGKVVETAGEIRDAGGAILAEATATFIRVPAETAAAWEQRYFG